MNVRVSAALAALLAAPVAFHPSASSAASEASRLATPERIAQEVRYRTDLHLDANPSYVRSLYDRGDADRLLATNGSLGALFTDAEAAELKARDKAVLDGQAAVGRLGLPAATWAGQYLDHRTGAYVVLVTENAPETERRLDADVPEPARLSVRGATVSYDALLAATDKLGAVRAALEKRGVALVTFGPDVVNNRLEIGATSDVAAARDAVRGVVDVPFVVVPAAPNEPRNNEKVNVLLAPPIRGGIDFRRPVSATTIARCSTGFVGYSPSGGSYLSNVTEYYMVSAGHCGPTSAQFTHATSYPLGPTRFSSFSSPTTTADALTVRISTTDRSNQLVLQYNPSTGAQTIGNVVSVVSKNTGVDIVGGRVCHTGTTSTTATLLRCGSISSVDRTATYGANAAVGYPGQTISRLRFANLHSEGGDSGASIVGAPGAGFQAEGILSGGPSNSLEITYFSQIRDVMSLSGLQYIKLTPNATID